MNAGARLGLYAGGLAVAFGVAFGLASLVAPPAPATSETEGSTMQSHGGGHGASAAHSAGPSLTGLSLSDGGMVLSPVLAPRAVGEDGTLQFRVERADGSVVTRFAEAHDKELHLIVVRSDGSAYRHVHPMRDAEGTWSLPWTWDAGGTYRVFADFTPDAEDETGVTLTRTIQVDGTFAAVEAAPSRVDEVDGFTVELEGDLAAGESSDLSVSVTRDGEPVTALEPYLGAFGHLVALRDGDLAYLHVHAEGEAPREGDTAGPTVRFAAQAPTAGRYLLYFDFQVDDVVRTAAFVVDAAHGHGGDHR